MLNKIVINFILLIIIFFNCNSQDFNYSIKKSEEISALELSNLSTFEISGVAKLPNTENLIITNLFGNIYLYDLLHDSLNEISQEDFNIHVLEIIKEKESLIIAGGSTLKQINYNSFQVEQTYIDTSIYILSF